MKTEELNDFIFAEIVTRYIAAAKAKRIQANPPDGRPPHQHPTEKEDYIVAVRNLRGIRKSCLEALREIEDADNNSSI